MTPAEVRRPRDDAELAQALALREEVFVGEQQVPLEADLDGLDDEAIQIVALADGGTVVGTCRLLVGDDGVARFGRLCVRSSARGHGVAAALLAEAEREARAAGAGWIAMHAQTNAIVLYLRAGYVTAGEPFDEEGIEHVKMEKRIA
ncbi:MAG: GNAT family N-acetyltransferase [Gaiellaceae bacterium]